MSEKELKRATKDEKVIKRKKKCKKSDKMWKM